MFISGTATAPFGGSVQINFLRVGGANLGYQPYSQNLYVASGSPYTLTVTPGVYDVCFYGINTSQKCLRSIVVANGPNSIISPTLSLNATVTFAVTESGASPAHTGYVSTCYQYSDPDLTDFYGFNYCYSGGGNQIVNGTARTILEPGTYQFRAFTSSGTIVTPYVVVPSGKSTVPITMPAPVPTTAAISGVLRGPDGQPIGGVPV